MKKKKLRKKIAQLEAEILHLRMDMFTLVNSPDSFNAEMIRLKMKWSQNVERAIWKGSPTTIN